MIELDSPALLIAAPVIAVLMTALAVWARVARLQRAGRWWAELQQAARRVGRLTPLALGLAAFAAGVALAGPRWGRRTVRSESKALDLVLVVDISRSMLAEDVAPSRLGRARREARRLVHDLAGDRIGLIAFSGQSYILSPLTIDGSALQLLIDALDPNMASAGGTELGGALRQGADLLQGGADVADRVLVVFTDGETHDTLSDVLSAAALCAVLVGYCIARVGLRWSRAKARELVSFSWPFVVAGFGAYYITFGDSFFLRGFSPLRSAAARVGRAGVAPTHSSTWMFRRLHISFRMRGQTATETSPRWALRRSSIWVRLCPIPLPTLRGISPFRMA